MNPSQIEAARALVTCPHFRWMRGMQVVHTPMNDGQTGYCLRLSQDGYVPAANEYPDFNDPATLGCLLELAREAWGLMLHTELVGAHSWRANLGTLWPSLEPFNSEGETLAAAILAAPVKP